MHAPDLLWSSSIVYCYIVAISRHPPDLLSGPVHSFKSGLSTSMCMGVLKAVVSHYNLWGSNVYGCLIDATKAFDTLDHTYHFRFCTPHVLSHLLRSY